MHWVLLILSIVAEVVGTLCLKWSLGFTRIWPSAGMTVCYVLTFILLTLCVRTLDLGLAYALWAGLSVAAVAACGVVLFHEPLTAYRVIGTILIIAGAVVLNLKGAVE